MATTVAGTGRRRGPLMPSLLLMLWLTPLLMLMPGTATTATDMGTTATDTDTATTAHTDMPTGAKQAKGEVDSSSYCDFPSTLASISRACAWYGCRSLTSRVK